MRVSLQAVAVGAVLLVAAGCGSGSRPQDGGETAAGTSGVASSSLPQGSEPVTLRPADFVRSIDNPYWPMAPGTRWVYRETDAEGNEQRVEVTVTHETKTILGIEATVVHDVVSEDGQLVEDTYDWYAQDADGNVWYLGEDTKEYYAGEAEDAAEVVSLDETADVPFGSYTGVLMTEDRTPLDPGLIEHKFYARGVGPVLAVTVSGGSSREELVTFEPGPA